MTKKVFFITLSLFTICLSLVAQTPKVTSNPAFARGATMAFGRMTAYANGGALVKEKGFCYAETPNPTIDNLKTTNTLYNNGDIYWLKDLKPATKYYMRAYAINEDNQITYGDVIKFYTIPMGQVQYSYWSDSGTDASINNRITNAIDEACYYFNNLTSAKRFYDVAYSPGTPTADCNYTDTPHMNVGANQSYQRCGTIMHEMEHGLGLQNYSTQWCQGNLRSAYGRGRWLGDRVTEAIQFWDNNKDTYLEGDDIHMWPYGVNGAHEDNGRQELYMGNAIICQALGEDGLEHSPKCFAEPYYSLNQEDTTKFYIKSESEKYGRYTSFLAPNKTGSRLEWKKVSNDVALSNDTLAWYFTFTPDNQFYQIRNAATGQYLTFTSTGTRTTNRPSGPTENDNFQLMRGRVDVDGCRGYWLIQPKEGWSPKCLEASLTGAKLNTFDISNNAVQQRFLILTADEMKKSSDIAVERIKLKINDLLNHIKPMKDVPHEEYLAGIDNSFSSAIEGIESNLEAPHTPDEMNQLYNYTKEVGLYFLKFVKATSEDQPFDLTFLITNPDLNSLDGWDGGGTLSYSCVEFFEKTFNFNQTLEDMPFGDYKLMVQGFQRPGSYTTAYNDYKAGTSKTTALLSIGKNSSRLANIARDASQTSIGGDEKSVSGNYMPNNMEAASLYFKAGLYENSVKTSINDTHTITISVNCNESSTNYWNIFDNFRLYFLGAYYDPTGINNTRLFNPTKKNVFTLDGRRIVDTNHLCPGIYIVNGKKIVVK